MSVRVISWVWDNSKSTGADRLVLLAIADAANDAGRDAYPSMTTIARKAGMDKRTAQRSVRALVVLGELAVSENAGPHGTNRYRIIMPKGRQDTTPRGDTPPVTDRPGETPRAASDPSGGGISSQQGWQDTTRTVLNPSMTRPSCKSSKGDRNETLRVVPATEPTEDEERCTRHPNGNPTGEPCHGCKRVEERKSRRASAAADRVARENEEAARLCTACDGTWVVDADKKPTRRRCDHRRTA